MPSFTVKASDFTMHEDPGLLFFSDVYNCNGYSSLEYIVSGSPAVYQVSTAVTDWRPTFNQIDTGYTYMFLAFDIDKQPVLRSTGPSNANFYTGSYTKVFDGVTHTVYFKYCPSIYFFDRDNFSDDSQDIHPVVECTGTQIFPSYQITNNENCIKVCNFFLFGEGSLDYDKPAQDIEDSDLDIVGLIGSVSDTYTGSDSFVNGLKSAVNNFIRGLLDKVTDGASSSLSSTLGLDNVFKTKLGSINTVVPGCSLVWDSPEVYHLGDSDPITYNIWIDGRADLSLAVYGENYSSSCSFQKLNLHSDIISHNSTSTFYYNTNTDYQVILDYILSHTDFDGNTSSSSFSQAVLNTTVSRIYIQASKVDENGNNLIGAISYVDFSSGYPVVFEGVTDTMEDIVPDSSGNGTTNTVNQPFVVSGDSIVYGDTITENNTTNNYYGEGLVIGGDIPFLSAAYWLIQAVLELIKTLYASLLVPFIVLGWTGHL